MNDLKLTRPPLAKTGMLIRRPPAEVFEAFVDPQITSNFWFTNGSGRLDSGAEVVWKWEMYDAQTRVLPKVVDSPTRLVIEWDGYSGRTSVEWKFAAHPGGSTFVSVAESGWTGSGDELAEFALSSSQGFTWTLAGLKAWLEHGVRLNLVADRFPRGPKEPFPDE
jgi:uncharacterized protein YndB with AHSA1/START domain